MKCLNYHHVGVWADDADEMISFFIDVLGFRRLTQSGPVFLQLGDGDLFEILSREELPSRPDMPAHMPGEGVAGVPHICLRVEDLPAWEEKLRSLGYLIHLSTSPKYHSGELGSARALWFSGPSDVDFELFEFEEEVPLNELPHE